MLHLVNLFDTGFPRHSYQDWPRLVYNPYLVSLLNGVVGVSLGSQVRVVDIMIAHFDLMIAEQDISAINVSA